MAHKFKLGQRVRRSRIGYADAKTDTGDVFEIIRLVPEDQTGEPFPWLFIDAALLEDAARQAGYEVDFIDNDESGQYLVRLTLAISV